MPYTDIRIEKTATYRHYKSGGGSGWNSGFSARSNSTYEDVGFFWLNSADLTAFNAIRNDLTITGASIFFPTSNPIWMVVSGTLGTTALTKSNYSSASWPFSLHNSQSIALPGGNDLNNYRQISAAIRNDLLSGDYGIAVLPTGTSDNYYNASATTLRLRVEYNYKSSTITPDNPSVECAAVQGETPPASAQIGITLTTTGTSDPPDSSYTHIVKCTLGSQTLTKELAAGVTTWTFTVPIEWCSEIPNSTSAVGAVTCETFSGTKSFGETSAPLTFTVPASVTPTAGTISYSVDNGLNTPISNSSLTASLSGQTGARGSTITSYTLTCEGYSATNGNLVIASVPLVHTQDGYRDVPITATVVDSRGRTATTTEYVRVYEWDYPYFTTLTAKRCDEFDRLTDTGTYVLLDGVYACYSVNSLNSVQSCTVKVIDVATGDEYNAGTLVSGTPWRIGNTQSVPAFATNKEYAIQVTITDEIATITYELTIYSTVYAIQFKFGGTGVSFGQPATEDNTVRINPLWALIIGNDINVAEKLAELEQRIAALE